MTRSRFSICVGALAAAGCMSPVEPSAPVVSLSAVATPASLQLGDTARIAVTVTNITAAPAQIGAGFCNTDFRIVGPDGTVYTPAEQLMCTLALMGPITIPPGASYQFSLFTTGRASPEGSQAAPIVLAPATYGVRALVSARLGNDEYAPVFSAPVAITFR